MTDHSLTAADFAGRPVVFRNATVVTVDSAGTLHDTDVLVVDDKIAAIGIGLTAPEGAVEIDATGGILMPGTIDTHRHMYQTALRGTGVDWTLTNYFMFYYVHHGAHFRPEDVYAGNLLAALESVDSGVTTTLDWSHGLRTVGHAEGALAALRKVPGRFVFAYGNLAGNPAEWAATPDFRAFAQREFGQRDGLIDYALAFDVTPDPAFPDRPAFEAARELDVPVTTHSGVWLPGVDTNDRIRVMADNGYLTDQVTHVHAGWLTDDSYRRIADSGGSISLSTESEASAGQGYQPSYRLREFGIPVSLSVDTSAWWSADMFSAMRATLNADRGREHFDAHEAGETIVNLSTRAEDVLGYATAGGAHAIGKSDQLGSISVGKKADLVLVKNDASPTMFPITNPEGHLVFQAGRGDVHTVVIDGKVLKHGGRLLLDDLVAEARTAVTATVEHLQSVIGEDAWDEAVHPPRPDAAEEAAA